MTFPFEKLAKAYVLYRIKTISLFKIFCELLLFFNFFREDLISRMASCKFIFDKKTSFSMYLSYKNKLFHFKNRDLDAKWYGLENIVFYVKFLFPDKNCLP